jgi:hypothetical protein
MSIEGTAIPERPIWENLMTAKHSFVTFDDVLKWIANSGLPGEANENIQILFESSRKVTFWMGWQAPNDTMLVVFNFHQDGKLRHYEMRYPDSPGYFCVFPNDNAILPQPNGFDFDPDWKHRLTKILKNIAEQNPALSKE